MNHHAPVNSTQRTQRLKVKNESSLGGKKAALLHTSKKHSTLCQVLQSDLLDPQETFSGLKRPPFTESKGHFEEAGTLPGLISMEPTKNCGTVQNDFSLQKGDF